MKKFTNIAFVLTLALLSVPLATGQANQEQGLSGGSGFRVADPTKELTIEAGTADTEIINVRNITSNQQVARAVVEDFGPSDDESGIPKILIGDEARENPYSIQPFVEEIQDVSLASGEQADVPVTFVIPEDASPGSYYGVVRFINSSDIDGGLDEEASSVSLNASVGVIFLISVPGETVDLLSLEQIGAARADGSIASVFGNPPTTLVTRIDNQGNTFQAPYGTIKVSDWSGNVIQEIDFNNKTPRGNVLPESVRRFDYPLENIGSFGRYKVEGFVSYGNGGNIIQLNTTFWVVPWLTVFVIAIIIIAVAFFATRGIKSYNRSIIRRAKGKSMKNMR